MNTLQTKTQTAVLFAVAIVAFLVGTLMPVEKSNANLKDALGQLGTRLCGGNR